MGDNHRQEGVEISDYVGSSEIRSTNRQTMPQRKADYTANGQQGSKAITVWAVVGLICAVAAPLSFFNPPFSLFYSLGLTYDVAPLLYQMVYYCPVGLWIASVIISAITLRQRHGASNSELVGLLDGTSLFITITVALITGLLFWAMSVIRI